jgi:hypothetical protein
MKVVVMMVGASARLIPIGEARERDRDENSLVNKCL